MMRAIDEFYEQQQEPQKSCFMALRSILSNYAPQVTEEWKYRLPCFYFKGKMLCYLWMDKKTKYPYVSFAHGKDIDHPLLISGDRKVFKILLINPQEDIPVEIIDEILQELITKYY